MNQHIKIGPWLVYFDLNDGARIGRLVYRDFDILTKEKLEFHQPKNNYGEYEMRPVYGYDDCFPSVDSCLYPNSTWDIPDHGELCWLSWKIRKSKNKLTFTVKSKNLPIQFIREMHFSENELVWTFIVKNFGQETLPFQHIMHPLIPLDKIIELNLPEFETAYDDINQKILDLKAARSISEFLLTHPVGSTSMLFLQQVKEGKMSWEYENGIRIEVGFPIKMFPSIGIWWNNQAYPNEEFLRRTECAFEPTPGFNSLLIDNYKKRECLFVDAGDTISWNIRWRIYLDKYVAQCH